MLGKSSARLCLSLSLFIGISLGVILLWGLRASHATQPKTPTPAYTIELVPDQMALSGDVTTISNCVQPTCIWPEGTPTGTIMLGVAPTSTDPNTWGGGLATAEVFLPDVYSPTVLVLRLSWPIRDGNGLHSPERNRMGTITLDGKTLWGKRTTHSSIFGDYYAAQNRPILTTIVITQSITHTLGISVPAHTAWDLSRIELTAYPYPAAIRGIGYSPFRDCQYPDGASQPSVQNLKEDLFRLFHTSNAIRTYASTGINGEIPSLANEVGLPIFAGAWLDDNPQDYDELEALCNLACTTDLEGVIVGNEYYLRHRSAEAIGDLKGRIVGVKDCIRDRCGKNVPVTTAEIDNLMFDWEGDYSAAVTRIRPIYRPILDEVDFIMVHIYPFWNGMPIDGAAAFTVERYKAMRALIEQEYPGQNKWIVIGETGWPSDGAPVLAAVPSPENQRRYMLELMYRAEQDDVEYMYFDAFDELWKIEEPGRVGQNWGYSYADRAAKHNFYGVLIPMGELYPYRVYLPFIVRSLSSGGPLVPVTRSFVDSEMIDAISREPLQTSSSLTFPVFTEWPMGPDDHFVPSGWMGDIGNIGLYECDRTDPHGGEMAVRVSFSPTGTLGWAGIYWQYPDNNWGNIDAGIDLSHTNKLAFWAKGEHGGERIRFFAGGIGTKDDPYPESLRPEVSTGFIELEDSWREYTINLVNQPLTRVIGGFGWATDRCASPTGTTFYLDDIVFEYDPDIVAPPTSPPPGSVFPVYTNAADQDNHYFPTGWMGDGEVSGRVSLTECWYENPHSEPTAIKIAYTHEVKGWAGTYWVHPSENWGDRPGGFNLTGTDRLTFWARSDTPDATVKFLVGGVGYPNGTDCDSPLAEPYAGSLCPKKVQEEHLSTEWTSHTIPLAYFLDLTRVVGGFGWVSEDKVTFYLDDIVYEFD